MSRLLWSLPGADSHPHSLGMLAVLLPSAAARGAGWLRRVPSEVNFDYQVHISRLQTGDRYNLQSRVISAWDRKPVYERGCTWACVPVCVCMCVYVHSQACICLERFLVPLWDQLSGLGNNLTPNREPCSYETLGNNFTPSHSLLPSLKNVGAEPDDP